MSIDKLSNVIRLTAVTLLVFTCSAAMLSQLLDWKWLADKTTYLFTAGFVSAIVIVLGQLGTGDAE